MKELIQIIEQLDSINRQIIEKDNLISHTQSVIDLVSQLMHDAQFVQSPIYLDLRAKYFSQIDDHLKKITETPTITIEPQNLISSYELKEKIKKQIPDDSKEKKKFTRDDVKAPLTTDIYTAPACRIVYSRKKDKDKVSSNKLPTTIVTQPLESISSPQIPMTLDHDSYFSFNFQGQNYYLSPYEENQQHTIYDEQMSIVGSLKGATVTINKETGTLTHVLRICDQTNQPLLFGSYYIEN